MDKLGVEKAVLVGHSAGGTIAVHTALRHPERVEALVLVAPAVYDGGGGPGWTRLLLRIPQVRHLVPLLVRSIVARGEGLMNSAWHDPSKITSEIMAGYKKPAQAENWDRALWEFFLASHPLELERQLDSIQMPTLVVTGDDDRWVPTEQSVRLATELPDAELVVIPECGHLPQEERPELFLQAVSDFLSQLP
jgi:pimeloyl-ACP methyl ester carboxylesterase